MRIRLDYNGRLQRRWAVVATGWAGGYNPVQANINHNSSG